MLTELTSPSEGGETLRSPMFALTSFHRATRFELVASSQQVFGRLTGLEKRTHGRCRANPRSKSNHAMQLTGTVVRPSFAMTSTFPLNFKLALSPGS